MSFINSDVTMIRLFLAWLELLGYGLEQLIFRISIHESADVDGARRFWSDVVGGSVQAVTLKRHNPTTVRKNTGDDYHGCLVVHVRRSTDLYRRIAGWWLGIADSLKGSTVGGRPMAGLGPLKPAIEVRPLAPEREVESTP